MDVRIGTTLEGRPAGFDTSRGRPPLLLIGDVGRGKTTIARYLTRWWLADTARHVHVYSQSPSEWADLRCEPVHPDVLEEPIGGKCRPGTCLVVVDDIDSVDDHRLALVPLVAARVILTSHGGNGLIGRPVLDHDISCMGLVRADRPDAVDVAALDGQGRLDWPGDTVAVIPDPRGPMDLPCHRWQASAARWKAGAR
ncbi:ATP-binding protein [Nocardioides sp. KR10-350]|uniref:ATP-binding protein n=1 Tax=Nocardioides cheoyonin TaxID=3156615 RepID=UPI0032B3E31D